MYACRNHFPVTGRSIGVRKAFDRLPVQELAADHPYQWTLFVLSFAYIKDTPIPFPGVVQPPLHTVTSLMELAGIHGKPYREWAGDRRAPEEAQVDFSYKDKKDMDPFPCRFGGYCHHAAITFALWHRPYVMLFEQVIGEYAENIAQQIEHSHPGEGGRWVDAAKQLRFPYWDWADPKVDIEGIPSLFYSEQLTITGVGQNSVTVPNPFVSFTFPHIPDDFFDSTKDGVTAYFSKWKKTYRHTQSTPDPTGSNVKDLQSAVKKNAESIRTSIGMLFTFPDSGYSAMIYDEFSNTRNESRQQGNYKSIGSLEGVHNTVHEVIGGVGHMSWTDYAAFDPIFFFHHCSVDRILALWEWCYPDYWMGDGYAVDGLEHKWTMAAGTYSSAYSQMIEEDGVWGPLVPFRHPDGVYWTSKEARFLTGDAYPKYYSYKEFLGIKVDKGADSLKERQEARARITKYYNVDPQKDLSIIHKPSWTHITVPDADEVDLPANFKPMKHFRIFKVLVRLREHAIGGSYHFSLYYKQELVGSVTVFARESNSPCRACAVRRAADSVVRGVITIPSRIINEIIVHSGILPSHNDMDVTVDLIAHALRGVLEDMGGTVIASAQGGAVGPAVPAEEAAPRPIQPREVALLSCAVADDIQDEKQPVYFFDWKHHVDLFPNGWKAESCAPAAQ